MVQWEKEVLEDTVKWLNREIGRLDEGIDSRGMQFSYNLTVAMTEKLNMRRLELGELESRMGG